MILKISHDESAESPRDWDNLGTIAYKHKRYVLGDESISDPIEWLEDILKIDNANVYNNQRLEELEKMFFEKFIALPVYIYEHSSVAISTTPFSCPWDSGKVGYIYISKDDTRVEYSCKRITKKIRDNVLSVFQAEIETLSLYAQGEVYYFTLYDDNGNVIDSCGGFFGSDYKTNGILDYLPSGVDINSLKIELED